MVYLHVAKLLTWHNMSILINGNLHVINDD